MEGCQARVAHDTFTLSPRLAPAPARLLLAQVRKEGTLPAAQPGADALSSTHRQDLLVPWLLPTKADAHKQH